MGKLSDKIKQSGTAVYLKKQLEAIVLPGAEKITLLEIVRFFFQEVKNVKLIERVAASTYFFVMAIPPTLLFIFTLIPYLPLENVQETILRMLALVITSPTVYKSASEVVINFMDTQREDLLSLGILLTLFFSSNGMMGLMRAFDHNESVYKKRSGLRRRWTAIKLTFMLLLVMIFSLAVFVVQSELVNKWMVDSFGSIGLIKTLSIIILLIITFFTISIIYTYGPSLVEKLRFFTPGSIFATVMISISSYVFFFLVSNFLHYNQVYGSIGTLIAFMVWIWLNTFMLLIGYQLNVSILRSKIKHHADKEEQS